MTGRCALKNGKRADGRPMLPGDPVFMKRTKGGVVKRHHIGYYVGEYGGVPMVIEAQGTVNGVCTNVKGLFPGRRNDGKGKPLTKWHETAHWLNVEYENGVIYMNRPVLKKGAGCGTDTAHQDAVRELQTLLKAAGCDLEADGKFGAKTESAVREYQSAHGLVPDGVVGAATWDSLIPETPGQDAPVTDVPGIDAVSVSRDTLAGWRRTIQAVAGEIDKVMGA